MSSLRITGLTKAGSVTSTDVLVVDGTGFASAKKATADQLGILAGKTVWVDNVNGSDAVTDGGVRGYRSRPFLTLTAAQTAASSGDLIHVLPGSYTLTTALGKNGVNWHLEAGVTITATSTALASMSVFSDGGTAMTFVVSGEGNLVGVGTNDAATSAACVRVSHASSVISVWCNSITQSTANSPETGTSAGCVYQTAGSVYVDAKTISISSVDTYGVWWINGRMVVHASLIEATGALSAAVGSEVTATTTGDMYVEADEIRGIYTVVYANSSYAEAKVWVQAKLITVTGALSAVTLAGGKLYVDAQKIAGMTATGADAKGVIEVTSGDLWIDCHKITGTFDSGIYLTGGTARIDTMQIEDLGTMTRAVRVTGGTLELHNAQCVMTTGDGVLHAGGTSRIMGCRFNTSAQAGKVPVRVSGSGLILDRCTLVPNAAADSVTAATAQTITNYGSVAKTAKNVNVTVNVEALLVDTNVV